MPRIVEDDDLKAMARKGKLPKGVSLHRQDAESGTDKQAKFLDTLVSAVLKSTEGTEKVIRLNTATVEMVLDKLKTMKEQPVTVNIPPTSTPKDWTLLKLHFERDYNYNIKSPITIEKVR